MQRVGKEAQAGEDLALSDRYASTILTSLEQRRRDHARAETN
jgi:hypothetical protein